METLLREITENILYLPADSRTDRPILAVISGSKKSLIIDSGNSSVHANLFLNEIKKYNITHPDYVVITHWHWDHIFGIYEMNSTTIANEKSYNEINKMKNYEWTREALDERVQKKIEIPFCAEMIKKEFKDFGNIKIALPDFVFKDKLEVDLGGITCIIENVGGDHSLDSTVIYVKEEKVLFLGDCLAPNIYNDKWYYNINPFLSLLNKIESYQADIYVESHWKPVEKDEFLNYLSDMKKIANTIKNQNGALDKIKKEIEETLNRDLTQDDYEITEYFLNGKIKEMKK